MKIQANHTVWVKWQKVKVKSFSGHWGWHCSLALSWGPILAGWHCESQILCGVLVLIVTMASASVNWYLSQVSSQHNACGWLLQLSSAPGCIAVNRLTSGCLGSCDSILLLCSDSIAIAVGILQWNGAECQYCEQCSLTVGWLVTRLNCGPTGTFYLCFVPLGVYVCSMIVSVKQDLFSSSPIKTSDMSSSFRRCSTAPQLLDSPPVSPISHCYYSSHSTWIYLCYSYHSWCHLITFVCPTQPILTPVISLIGTTQTNCYCAFSMQILTFRWLIFYSPV